MHPLHPSGSFFFFIITFVLIHAPKFASSVDESYVTCNRTFACGNIENIGYPFWGSDRPAYCGLPEFQLNCGDSTPEITIMSATYKVLGINNDTRVLTLAREDYLDDLCPTSLINTTLNPDLFQLTSDSQYLNLYYRCPSIPSQDIGFFTNFTCDVNKTIFSVVYLNSNLSESTGLGLLAAGNCGERVVLAAKQSEIQSAETSVSLSSENLVKALEKGFGLQWNANNSLCDRCRGSGGQCGYNTVSNNFSCYCTDQPYATVCPTARGRPAPAAADKKKISNLDIGLFIVGGVIAGILLGGGCLLWRQRRKRIAAQSQSKDLPATPSSNGPVPIPPSTKHSEIIHSYYHSSKSDLEKGSTYFGVQVFSYSELEEATHNFDPSKELGEGGFGTVYYGVLGDGRAVAVKRLFENNLKRVEQFMNEIKIVADTRHPNLVTLYGCTSRHSRELLLVYEYIPNGTVADHLHGRRAKSGLLTWPVRLSIAIETAYALAYLHGKEIIHRDVKTNNILLDCNFHVKVADFGLSRLFPNDVTHVSTAPQGTPGYVDPEYYQCYHLTDKSDVYSFGVVLIELISAKQAVDTNRHRYDINLANMAISRIQNQALNELVDPSLAFETDYAVRRMITTVAELAFQCLQQERDVRPSMEEVLAVLKGMQNEELTAQIAEVVDIGADDVGLLRHVPPPLSPDSAETEKWVQIRTM